MKTKLTIEIELERDEKQEWPPFATVNSVKVNGALVSAQYYEREGSAAQSYWPLIRIKEGYDLIIEESLQ